MSSLACAIYAILFLKLWSYVQVNYWCRMAYFTRGKAMARTRQTSLLEFNQPGGAVGRPFPSSKYFYFLVEKRLLIRKCTAFWK